MDQGDRAPIERLSDRSTPSLRQRIVIGVLRLQRRKARWSDGDRFLAAARADHAHPKPQPPQRIRRLVDVKRDDSAGFPIFTVRPNQTTNPHHGAPAILYIHGGGYVHDFSREHWTFIATLANRTGRTVITPQYPLAPEHTWRNSFPQLMALARGNGHQAPILMGDSAGGGYALALAQTVVAQGQQPDVILISPLGDATVTLPDTSNYERADPWLSVAGIRAAAQAWARPDDPRRPEISPLFGNFTGLSRLMIFTGTRDVLYPQACEIATRARNAGATCQLIVKVGSIHVYPLLPIPEAKQAMDEIVSFVRDGLSELPRDVDS